MVITTSTRENLVTNSWVKASWEEFIALADNRDYEKGKFYYDREYMRIEMSPVGPLHARHNSIVSSIVKQFALLKNIGLVELTNATFRQPGLMEFQPDLSYYVGEEIKLPPRTNTPINLNEFYPPTIAVEIGESSISDDLGEKRLMYEQSGVKEYWVVNAKKDNVIAFSIANGSSGKVLESQVLKGLSISLVEEALKYSQTKDDIEVLRWFIQRISQSRSQ